MTHCTVQYDELITLTYPTTDTTLVVFNLTANVQRTDLQPLFELYGLLHDIVLRSKTTTHTHNETRSAEKDGGAHAAAAHSMIAGRSQSDGGSSIPAAVQSNAPHSTSTTPTKQQHNTAVSCVEKTTYYAFVTYYSVDECLRARAALHKRTVCGTVLSVQRQSNMGGRHVKHKRIALKHHYCIQLLNHFIGFNGYNVQLLLCERYSERKHAHYHIDLQTEQQAQNISQYKSVYIAEVVVSFAAQYCMNGTSTHRIHAVGISFCTGTETSSLAIKRAVTYAHNTIFQDIAIVRLSSGKTCICSVRTKQTL